MVIRRSLSTGTEAKVCTDLAEQGVAIPTPTQSGVWRSVIRSGEKEKEHIKRILQTEEDFCLHFDGKNLCGIEYQVVCLKSENREIKLGVLKCKSGSAQNIFNKLEQLLNEFAAWSNIKMIISDTTSVNTGRLNGIVVKLQKKMSEMGLEKHSSLGASIMF